MNKKLGSITSPLMWSSPTDLWIVVELHCLGVVAERVVGGAGLRAARVAHPSPEHALGRPELGLGEPESESKINF